LASDDDDDNDNDDDGVVAVGTWKEAAALPQQHFRMGPQATTRPNKENMND
jgi:hypothetical protein